MITEMLFSGQKKQNGHISFGNWKSVIEEHTERTRKIIMIKRCYQNLAS